jgi:replicative DNA helicase
VLKKKINLGLKVEENKSIEEEYEMPAYKVEEEESKQMEDFFQTTLDDMDTFENRAWHKGDGYKSPGFPELEEKLEGWEAGFYLFAAESNVGKSAAMLNIVHDMSMCESNKLFGLYYSLDDNKFEIIPRIIAMDQLIPISVASKPQRYQNRIDSGEEGSSIYEDMLKKRTLGIEKIRNNTNRFKVEDGTRITSVEELYAHMKQVQVYIKAMDPEANIMVAIDSINDLKFSSQSFPTTRDKHDAVARIVKEWTVELDIIIMGASHLKKINQNRRPVLDDLKESGEYVYEASAVWLLFNDVSKNKEGAKVYYNQESQEGKGAVIEFDWAKNKKSSFKGRTFNYFSPEYSRMSECDTDVMKRFNALVYEG